MIRSPLILENRLDDFFSDELPSQDEPPADERQAPKTDLPLKDLKSTILAIDWEITDEVLETFIGQLDGLLEQFENDKVVHTLLKLLKSLANMSACTSPKPIRTPSSESWQSTLPWRNQLPTMI
jgi:hypothetical protein